ncbi:MAG: mechanosensitive ion channel domain-containing protein, partial [Pseudomonadota bacterium]
MPENLPETLSFFAPLIEQLLEFVDEAMRLLPQLTLAVLVIGLTSLAAFLTRRSIQSVLTRGAMRPALVQAIRTIAGISVWLLGALLAITIAFPSVTPAKMLGAIGLGGVAIGLAFREMLENFIAGIMIMVRKPMRIGDVIVVDDVYGRIE